MVNVKDLLKECSAFLQGHFLLSSGKHSDGYVQCARLLMYPDKAEKVISVVAEKVKDLDTDLVIGPAMGGIIVSYELGRQLGLPAMFTERENDIMTLRRGFKVDEGAKVLIAEDVITTGKSSLETIKALEAYGVQVLGIACMVNRSGLSKVDKYPIYSAIELDINTYDEECPLCKEGLELVKPGSRKKF
ncbi:MAG: orotate phosphoribosyltransferase [Tissierellia bacterium]|nr:orotate phosphoribosyltransferase [Tissierellia bacterium]